MKKTLFIFTVLALFGMAAYLPFITVGSKKLTDSANYIVSSSGLKANGDINYTGNLYKNGNLFDTTKIFYKSDTAGYFNRYNLDTTRFLDLSDTSSYVRKESGISQLINSIVTFGTDIIVSWIKNQSSVSAYQYEKVKIVASTMPSTVSTAKDIVHGITNWHTIKSWTAVVEEDSLNKTYSPGAYYTTATLYYAYVDSLYCRVETGGSATSIKSDSVFFRIIYTDFSR